MEITFPSTSPDFRTMYFNFPSTSSESR
jgi:hypothetical protein